MTRYMKRVSAFALFLLAVCATARSATNGPLQRYSENPMYFADKDDTPVWLTGMSVCCPDDERNGWPWISNGAIDKLAAHGGNWAHIRLGPFMNTAAYLAPYAPYKKSGDKYDLNEWNDQMWTDLRSLLAHAQEEGVYIEVDLIDAWILERSGDWVPWHSSNNINGVDAAGCGVTKTAPRETHKKYLRKIAKETGDFDNVIYQVGNETFDCGGSSVAWEDGVIKTVEDELESLGKGARLFSTNSHKAEVEQSGYVDYVNVHGGGPDGIHHGKPTGNNEYANLSPDGFTGNLWNKFIDGCFFHYWVGSNGSSDRETTYDRIKHFMDFVHSIDFGSFQTISDRVTGDEGREYVGYGSSISIDLPEGSYDVSWLNPKTGEKRGESSVSGGGTETFNSPGGDQVLHVRKPGTVSVAPGGKSAHSSLDGIGDAGGLQSARIYAPDGRCLGLVNVDKNMGIAGTLPPGMTVRMYLVQCADGTIRRNVIASPTR